MMRTYINELKGHKGKSVVVKGFVQTIRDQGGIKFLMLRDFTGEIQIVILKSAEKVFADVKDLTLESVVEIEGFVKEEKQAPGGFELKAERMEILSLSDPELPIPVMVEKGGDESEQTIRFDWRWIDIRRPEKLKIFKVWTELEKGFRQFFAENNFIQIYAPMFLSAPSEGGAEVFEVKYFDRRAYLAQSPQFHKQMAMAAGLEKVFITGPIFRAEPSYTTRHMTEFTGWDFEISYINSHEDVMATEEQLISQAYAYLKKSLELDIDVPSLPFPRVTMLEAKAKLKAAGINSEKEHDFSPEEERELSRLIKEETGHDFVFVKDYHISVRPFYHMRYADNPTYTMSFDLLYKGVEITTGAQREHRYEILKTQAIEKGVEPETIKDYLNFFRFGCPPHGGVGMGPARIIMKLLDLPSVKEATYLPRDVKRLTP